MTRLGSLDQDLDQDAISRTEVRLGLDYSVKVLLIDFLSY